MRVILIIFLILFLIISSLFLITFISKISPDVQDMLLAAENVDNTSTNDLTGDSNINNISDIEPDTVSDLEGLATPENEEGMGSDNTGATEESDEENDQSNRSNTLSSEESANNDEEAVEPDNTNKEDDPEDDTVKIYLDGDRDNGIYLGAATYGIESSRAAELYGTEFKETGFKFEWKNTSLKIEPGSTHFIYIYYYNKESGWEYIRKEVNIPGQKSGNNDIKVFIDHPKEQEVISGLSYMDGWALDISVTENTGISKIKIYLDGPIDFGRHLGNADYGIPRQGVADFFKNNNYLYSGYNLSLGDLSLEEGTKHTVFIYAIDSSNPNIFNFEKRDIFLAGKKEEKSLIEATVDFENFITNNTLNIEGYAISEAFQEISQDSEDENNDEDSQVSSSSNTTGYSLKRIVFMSDQDGNYNIFSMSLDGSDRQRLTDHIGADQYPEVSPDNQKIAYTADINGVWQIMIMDWNGQNKRQITHNNFRSAYPTWSHDMKYIYFEASIDGDWEIYRINSDGTGQIRLTHNSRGHDWHPNAHPFDNKIIFESGMPGHDNIYIMNGDGTSVYRLFGNDDRRRVPSISNDSTMVTYTKYFGNNCEVHYANIQDQNEIRISYNNDADGHSTFSPDDKLIAYEQRSGSQENIIIYNIETGQTTNITNIPNYDLNPSFIYQ